MANKPNKTENFTKIMEILVELNQTELAEVMNHEIELLKSKADKAKASKATGANAEIKHLILEVMKTLDKPVTITELLKASPELQEKTGNSNQKVSSLVTQMLTKNGGNVERTQEGKKAVFKIA